ncbi:MAG: PQQ-binding-like beta-propeller repeat protein [Fuerstiella sp.]
MRHFIAISFVLASSQISNIYASDWTEFRGSAGQGHAQQIKPAVSWSESENITWKVELPGMGWSSPIVADGHIYVTAAVPGSKSSLSLRTMKLKAASGQVVWDNEVFEIDDLEGVQHHKKNSHASPTPIIRDGRIYVHFGTHGTACLDESGKILWKNSDLVYSPMHGGGGSPALTGNRLVICCDGSDKRFVVGLDCETGQEVWRTQREFSPSRGFSFSTPMVIDIDGAPAAVCPGSGGVFAYQVETGEQLWRVNYNQGYSVIPRPVVGHGLIYVCSGFGDGQLLAIDPNGTGDITDDNVRWKVKKGVPKSPSVILVDESIYMVDDAGIATSVNALTGDVQWQKRLKGKYSASPVYAGGHIYFQSETGQTTVVKPGDSLEIVETNQLGDGKTRTFASFAFDGDAILLRSETALYRIETR